MSSLVHTAFSQAASQSPAPSAPIAPKPPISNPSLTSSSANHKSPPFLSPQKLTIFFSSAATASSKRSKTNSLLTLSFRLQGMSNRTVNSFVSQSNQLCINRSIVRPWEIWRELLFRLEVALKGCGASGYPVRLKGWAGWMRIGGTVLEKLGMLVVGYRRGREVRRIRTRRT